MLHDVPGLSDDPSVWCQAPPDAWQPPDPDHPQLELQEGGGGREAALPAALPQLVGVGREQQQVVGVEQSPGGDPHQHDTHPHLPGEDTTR